jgi:hypothetical protein
MGGPARARHELEKARPDVARPYQARWPLRAVSGRAVVPTLRPRHDTKAFFSCRAGTTARLAHRAGAGPSGSAGPSPTLPCRQAAAAMVAAAQKEGPGGSHGGGERRGGRSRWRAVPRRTAQISRPAPRRREGGGAGWRGSALRSWR